MCLSVLTGLGCGVTAAVLWGQEPRQPRGTAGAPLTSPLPGAWQSETGHGHTPRAAAPRNKVLLWPQHAGDPGVRQPWGSGEDGITASFRLEKTLEIVKSNHKLSTAKATTNPCPSVPHLHEFSVPPGMGTQPHPWAAWPNA